MRTSLDIGNQNVFNVPEPALDDHPTTKKYAVSQAAVILRGINKLKTDVNQEFIASQGLRDLKADKCYVDLTFLKLSGETMTGNVDMSSQKIVYLAPPTSHGDVASKDYVDKSHVFSLREQVFLSHVERERIETSSSFLESSSSTRLLTV